MKDVLMVVIPALISAAASIVVCIVNTRATVKKVQAETVKIQAEKTKALELGVQALLRAQMICDYNKYTDKGFAPIWARENFENVWEQYEALGENGVMNDIHNKFLALPTQKKGEEE